MRPSAVQGAMSRDYTKDKLTSLPAKHHYFVGVDSDGCVFDTMEIKQKQCFHGLIVSHWKLEPVEKYVRETAEFVNLYSKWRGSNRFFALLKVFDLLRERREILNSGIKVPALESLRKFISSGVAVGNPQLEKAVRDTGDLELQSVLTWSHDINQAVRNKVKKIPPFKWARESLEKIAGSCDLVCVSQTPVEALVREWDENNLRSYPAFIAGQELGTKTEHIAMATRGKYNPDNMLMIGDALGDLKAAKENRAHFFPINPAGEEKSWELFYKEACDRFLAHSYGGKYEAKLTAGFEALLPEKPAWEN